MAKPKKKRTKKYSPEKQQEQQVMTAAKEVVKSMCFIGSHKHKCTYWDKSKVHLLLNNNFLKDLAYGTVINFLNKPKPWTLFVVVFSKEHVDSEVETYPANTIIPETTLKSLEEDLPIYVDESVKALIEAYDVVPERLCGYGYYLNFGDDILIDEMEEDLINLFSEHMDIRNAEPGVELTPVVYNYEAMLADIKTFKPIYLGPPKNDLVHLEN